MARLITRTEFAKDIAERVKTLKLMVEDTTLVCPVCYGLYDERTRTPGDCWCDYESDWQND